MAKSLLLASAAMASLLLARHEPTYFPSVTWTFVALSSVLFTSLFTYRIVLKPLVLSPLRHIPTPPGAHWLIGHFATIYRNPTGHPQLEWLESLPDNNGLIRYMGLFNVERIMVCSPKTLSEALQQKSYAFIKPDFMRKGIGRVLGMRGILFAEGDEHRHQRKLLLPAFSHAHIKNLVPTFWSSSRELADKLADIVAASATTPVIEMGRWSSLATLDIIGRAGFGYEFRALESAAADGNAESKSELAQAYDTLFKPTPVVAALALARAVLPSWFLWRLPLARTAVVNEASETIKRVSLEIIDTKKREIAAAEKHKKDSDTDILSVMLKSGQYEGADGAEVMRDQMMTFLAAGHETTATAMIWGLHVLALKENRHIQTRLRNEIRAAFPHGLPELVTYEQIEALKYLRNVTSEVLRFYPPVPLTARHSDEDTTLGGEFIPKGTHIVIVPWAINRSTALWGPDAGEFKPERWEEGGQAESNYAFNTFLAGPRGCIGNSFAKVEYKCLMAALIGRFDFEQEVENRKIVIKGGITAKPTGGIPLKVNLVPGW